MTEKINLARLAAYVEWRAPGGVLTFSHREGAALVRLALAAGRYLSMLSADGPADVADALVAEWEAAFAAFDWGPPTPEPEVHTEAEWAAIRDGLTCGERRGGIWAGLVCTKLARHAGRHMGWCGGLRHSWPQEDNEHLQNELALLAKRVAELEDAVWPVR